MRRAELAERLLSVRVMCSAHAVQTIDAAVARLRQTCAGCDFWPHEDQRKDWPSDVGRRWCRKWHTGLPFEWPIDCSSHCHQWEAK